MHFANETHNASRYFAPVILLSNIFPTLEWLKWLCVYTFVNSIKRAVCSFENIKFYDFLISRCNNQFETMAPLSRIRFDGISKSYLQSK